MYLHLGADTVVAKEDIVAIFDADNSSSSKITMGFLSSAQSAGDIVDISGDIPRSFILWERDGKRKVFLSQLSPQTLLRRSAGVLPYDLINMEGNQNGRNH